MIMYIINNRCPAAPTREGVAYSSPRASFRRSLRSGERRNITRRALTCTSVAASLALVTIPGAGAVLPIVGASLGRILLGFGFATLLGATLGTLIAHNRHAHTILLRPVKLLQPIPAIVWIPISIMLWPTAEGSVLFITFLGAFFPILVSTVHAVASVDQTLVRSAQTLGAARYAVLREVVLPAALPSIFAGLAVGMGVAWEVSVLSADMVSGQHRIGKFTWEASSLIRHPEIVIGMIVIGVLGLLCSGAIRTIGKVSTPWA
jgi:NitT/TauT family transport system permease protein